MPTETTLRLDELEEGSMKAVDLGGEQVVVAKVGGECFAFGGLCTHEDAPMAEGTLEGATVTCPWHFSEFDVKTGAVLGGVADKPLPSYEVRVDGDEIRIVKP